MALVTAQFGLALQILAAIIAYFFLPFASLWSFQLYAWIGNLKLVGAFVATEFSNYFGSVIGFVARLLEGLWPGVKDVASGVNEFLANDDVFRWLQILAAIASFIGLFRGAHAATRR